MLKNEPHQYKDQQSLYAPPHNMHIKKILYLYLARSCAARATLNYHIEGCCDKVQNNNNASIHIRTDRRRPSLLSSWSGLLWWAGGMAYCHATTRYLHTITRASCPPFAHEHTHVHSRIEIFFTNLRTKLIYHRESNRKKTR